MDDSGDLIDRFLSHGGFGSARGTTESIREGRPQGPPATEDVERIAGSLVRAAKEDPLAFGMLGVLPREDAVRESVSSAMNSLRREGRAARLSAPERCALEAIIRLKGRPVLFIRNDTFDLPEGEWELLAPHKSDIAVVVRSVGRIGIAPVYGLPYAGTGFVAGKDIVMTNRHVIQPYISLNGDRWELDPGVGMTIDFKQEFGTMSDPDSVFPVVEVVAVHPDNAIDLALVRIAARPGSSALAPGPLRLQKGIGYAQKDDAAYVVGYPASDESRNDPAEMHRIFMGAYEKKRLSPGRVVSVDPGRKLLAHDCTTLGGNSGSCVVDLNTHSVIGLHFEGEYGDKNTALLIPQLADDPLLKGLNFREGTDGR